MEAEDAKSALGVLGQYGAQIGQMFINLSSEYEIILEGIFWIFAFIGLCLAISAVFDIVRIGDSNSDAKARMSAIWWKMFSGASLIDISYWTGAWAATLWANTDPLDISQYVVSSDSGGDNSRIAMMAAIGFIVLAGYVTLGRAYIAIANLGNLSADARGSAIGGIFARICAGSCMVVSMHVASMFENSTGFNWISQ